jgi:hypothetical protein
MRFEFLRSEMKMRMDETESLVNKGDHGGRQMTRLYSPCGTEILDTMRLAGIWGEVLGHVNSASICCLQWSKTTRRMKEEKTWRLCNRKGRGKRTITRV